MEKPNTTPASAVADGRLLSLDTLRGVDMLFIMGAEMIFVTLGHLLPGTPLESVAKQMHHVAWDGFTLYDLIFPLFLFIAGISFPFSLAKSLAHGASRTDIALKVLRRSLLLILLGAVYNGLLSLDFANVRYLSVLGRIGSAWMLAALLYLWLPRKYCLLTAVGILLGYGALLLYVQAPDYPEASSLSLQGNIVGYVDRVLMPGSLHQGIFDPEGLLSTLPAIVTALMGMFTGKFVRSTALSGNIKSAVLFLAGLLLLVLGWLCNGVLPVNKSLWSSTFVCVAGGLSMMLFAAFYWVVDVLQCRRWTLFFRVVGMNSITIYLAQQFVDFRALTSNVFGGVVGLLPENLHALGYWTAYVLTGWLLLYFLYRKRIFLRV